MFKKLFDPSFDSSFLCNNKCYLSSTIPGKTITKSLGLTSMVTKRINGNITKEFENLMDKFVKNVENLGGNAIINFQFETGSYQQQGSSWVVTYIIMYGEGVVVD